MKTAITELYVQDGRVQRNFAYLSKKGVGLIDLGIGLGGILGIGLASSFSLYLPVFWLIELPDIFTVFYLISLPLFPTLKYVYIYLIYYTIFLQKISLKTLTKSYGEKLDIIVIGFSILTNA